MEQQEILAYLRKTATEDLQLTPAQVEAIRPEVVLSDGLSLDSLAATILVNRIETDFGIMFEPEDMQRVRTVGDLINAIQHYTAEKKA